MKKILSCLLILCLILSLAACGENTKESEPSSDPKIKQTADLDQIVMSTEHFSINLGELAYFFAMEYSSYSSYLSLMGVNPDVSLKTQYQSANVTWFELFLDEAMTSAEAYLLFSEKAFDMGYELDDSDRAYIAKCKKSLEDSAAEAKLGLEEYIYRMLGTNVGSKYVLSSMEKMCMADKAFYGIQSSYSFSAEEVQAEYAANMGKYSKADYTIIYMDHSAENIDGIFKTFVPRFEAVKTKAEFDAAAMDYYLAMADFSGQTITGTREEYAKKALASASIVGGTLTPGNMVSEWIFSGSAKDGDIHFMNNSDSGDFGICYVAKAPYRDTTYVTDVRHILFKTETYGSLLKAHQKAAEIYEDWKNSGSSMQTFSDLCAEYSEDSTANTGGLYEGVKEGQMVAAFNDWLFDKSRKVGDSDIVDTEYGAHIIYFAGGNEAWYSTVVSAMKTAAYNKDYEKIIESYTVDSKLDVAYQLNW